MQAVARPPPHPQHRHQCQHRYCFLNALCLPSMPGPKTCTQLSMCTSILTVERHTSAQSSIAAGRKRQEEAPQAITGSLSGSNGLHGPCLCWKVGHIRRPNKTTAQTGETKQSSDYRELSPLQGRPDLHWKIVYYLEQVPSSYLQINTTAGMRLTFSQLIAFTVAAESPLPRPIRTYLCNLIRHAPCHLRANILIWPFKLTLLVVATARSLISALV